MKKGLILTLTTVVAVSSGFFLSRVPKINEIKEVNAASSYTIRDFLDYLEDKREHYPLSDEFIERYQQASGGYIDYAKQCGILVDKTRHSPNQKWHFFESWFGQSDFTGEEDAKTRIYNGLKCPELLLWIFEAMGVEPNKVRNAKVEAEIGRVNNVNVSTIAKNMRSCVSWEDLTINLV